MDAAETERKMKLSIYDAGDPSIGIFPATYTVDCPFERGDVDSEELENFREKMFETYKEYAQGMLTVCYDFEL